MMVSFHHGEAGIVELVILVTLVLSVLLYIIFSKSKKSHHNISSKDDVEMWN